MQGSSSAAVPSADSAAKLNRAGLWREALRVARLRMPVADADEKCSLRIDILESLDRMGLLEGAASEFRTFDPQCLESASTKARAGELARIRSETTLPPLPTTGLDFSGVDEFWRLADQLTKDVEPSEDDWHRYGLHRRLPTLPSAGPDHAFRHGDRAPAFAPSRVRQSHQDRQRPGRTGCGIFAPR